MRFFSEMKFKNISFLYFLVNIQEIGLLFVSGRHVLYRLVIPAAISLKKPPVIKSGRNGSLLFSLSDFTFCFTTEEFWKSFKVNRAVLCSI